MTKKQKVEEGKNDPLFIVDGSYLLYRSFYAIRPLYTSAGIPTQAIYGFARTLKKIIDKFNPHNLVIAWDSKGPTFRTEIYPPYKEKRQAPPNDLLGQKQDIIDLIKTIGIFQGEHRGFEADDIIYSIVHDHQDRDIVIVCADKDLFQLLRPTVKIFDPFSGRVFDEHLYQKEQGMSVAQIPFFYALLGDASDNIPGVEGIGKKTALDLVNQFESLDDLYDNLDRVKKERLRTLLTLQKEQAFLSLKLFTLKYCKIHCNDADFVFDKTWWAKAAPIFARLEFSSLLKEIERTWPEKTSNKEPQSLIEALPVSDVSTWECIIVETEDGLKALVQELKHSGIFAVDTETTGILPMQDDLVGISFAIDATQAYYIPIRHHNLDHQQQLSLDHVLAALKPVLEANDIEKILHNAKFDHLIFYQKGVNLAGVTFDTIIAANLIRDAWQKINLKDLSAFFLKEPMQTYVDVVGKEYKTFADVPIVRGARYGAHDALQTLKLKTIFEKKLHENKVLRALFYKLEMPLYPILMKMEALGITLDVEKIKSVENDVVRACQHVEEKFFAALDGIVNPLSFNLNSPKQIEWLLFDQLKLPAVKKSSKGQRSTDQEVLQELRAHSPIAELIARYRELTKLKSTYLEPLPTFINPKTGKIHTSYSQTMVVTGRLSSSNPNLQNIPAGKEFGIQIRSAFIPDKGKIFLSADYSQIELRVLAHLSKDENLLDAFCHDKDIHMQTAAQLFDVAQSKVTHEQRQLGKKINFSIIYGLTPFGLSKDLGIKPSEAKEYIEKYFNQYPGVARWIEKTVEQATELGYVETLFGHRRSVPGLKEKNKHLYDAERRIAINTPVQGTAADVMKMAMIGIDAALTKADVDAQIILQIHDELIIQLKSIDSQAIAHLVKYNMEAVVDWSVPLKVTIRTGSDWGDVTAQK